MRRRPELCRVGGLVLVAGLLAGCGGLGPDGRFREDPIGNIEQQLIGNTLAGLGIVPRQRERIDYSARPPLALPPRGQAGGRPLPEPEDSRQIVGATGNWPRDPDVWRRERDAAERNRPADDSRVTDRGGRTMTVEEMEAQRSVGPDPSGRGIAPAVSMDRERRVLTPDELERGWAPPTPGSIFTVDETVDVRDRERERQEGRAQSFIREQGGSSNQVGGRQLQRIDTTNVAAQPEPVRRTIADPPPGFRTPAPDPTGGVVTEADRTGRPFWERLFGR